MIFLLLLVVFTYVLHKMCTERGLSPTKHLVGFITGFILILFATSFALILVYGENILKEPNVGDKVALFSPFAMLFQFLLFVFFRLKIARLPLSGDQDDDPTPPSTDEGEKDFSYFR